MSGDGIAVMAQPQPKSQADTGDYTFSSSSFRKKKKKKGSKKIKTKKLITEEEAASKPVKLSRSQSTSALTRSQSMSALLKTTSEEPKPVKKKKSSAPKATPAIVAPPPLAAPKQKAYSSSEIQKVETKKSTTKSRGQRELELELELSPSGSCRDIRKPWETDIRDKEKSERGERILCGGASSTESITSSRAASHHRNFRRARSLSTTRHRSLSSRRYRSPSIHRRSLFSEWDISDDEDETTSHPDDTERSEFDNCDQTYETYRQFLASSKNTEQDNALSRKSVLSLKQKVGAAPSMEISYRYSAAADELLNAQYDDENEKGTSKDECKATTEDMTNPSEPEDPTIDEPDDTEKLWEHPAFLGAASPNIDPSNDGEGEEEIQPVFLGAVGHEHDVITRFENVENPKQEPSSVEDKTTSGSTVLLSPIEPLDTAPSNDSDDRKRKPVFLGDVSHDDDASVDSLYVENSGKDLESSSVVEEKANSPLPSPVTVKSSPLSPSSTRSPSPKTTSSTKEKRSPSPPRQSEEKDDSEVVSPDLPRLWAEARPSYDKELISSESDSDMVDGGSDSAPTVASEEKEDFALCASNNAGPRDGCKVEAEALKFDSKSQQDDAKEIDNGNEPLPSDSNSVQTQEEVSHSGRIQLLYAPSLLDQNDENIDERDSIFRHKDFDTEMPPLLKRSPMRSVDDADSPIVRRKSPARINDSEDFKPMEARGRIESPTPTVNSDEDKPIALCRRKSPSRRVDSDDDKPVITGTLFSDAINQESDKLPNDLHHTDLVSSPSATQCSSSILGSEDVDPIQGSVYVFDEIPETHSLHSLDSEDFDSIPGPVENEDCDHGNAENPQCPDSNPTKVLDKYQATVSTPPSRSHAPKLEEVDPVHDISGYGDAKESSKESTYIRNDDYIDEAGDIDDSSFLDMDEDPDLDYPEEEREYISLLYDIYMH